MWLLVGEEFWLSLLTTGEDELGRAVSRSRSGRVCEELRASPLLAVNGASFRFFCEEAVLENLERGCSGREQPQMYR
jgi:hypothetical protein